MTRFSDLPLFASDAELGKALLGKRDSAWRGLVPLYEKRGLPKIDPLMGGRYVPAVKKFFDHEYGLTTAAPAAPQGIEGKVTWNDKTARKHQGSNFDRAKVVTLPTGMRPRKPLPPASPRSPSS